jgi:hypothetical protein
VIASLTALVIRLAAIRWAIKTLVGVGVLVPVAFLLKVVGLPVLGVLGVLALPVLFVLFLLGLPIFLVMIVGGLLLGGLFFLLTLGLFAFKIFLFVVLPVWLIWKLAGFLWRLARPAPSEVAPAGVNGSPVS